MAMNIRNEIKSYIVKEMNKARSEEEQTTPQNISNKLTRGTIKYSECKEIAGIIGYSIEWVARAGSSEGSSTR